MLPPALRDLVIANDGVVTRGQLRKSGLDQSTLWRQVRRGDWRTYGRTVLIAAWAPDDFRTNARAAMASRPELPATGLAAVLQYPESPLTPLIDAGDIPWLVADRAGAGGWKPVAHPGAAAVLRAGSLVLLEEDILLDLMRLLPFEQAIEAAWLGLQHGLSTADRLAERAQPLLRLAGRGQLRSILDIIGSGARSSGEARMITIMERAGLRGVPDYRVNVGDRRFRIDYAFPEAMLGLEFDGYRFHSGPAATNRDSRRHNILANAGWDIRYFTWHDVVRTPDLVVEQVRAALQQVRFDGVSGQRVRRGPLPA